jgi:glutathione peroxidase
MTVQNNSGELISLDTYKNKVLLIVNVASHCGFTKQYAGLEKLQEQYHSLGFEVLAFPCNQFGAQEPGSDAEIASFCQLNYKTTFPLFSKIDVNGPNASPLYVYLKKTAPGLLGTEAIKWNFTKFLLDKNGIPVKRFAPQDEPEKIQPHIQELIK